MHPFSNGADVIRTRARCVGLAVAIAGLLTACHHSGGVGQAAAGSAWNGVVTVRVVNHSWLDVTIYVLQGTHRDRIGTATATSTTEFKVAIRSLTSGTDYRLYADPIGSRQTVRSEALHAQDGDIVTWTLEDNLERSSIDVR